MDNFSYTGTHPLEAPYRALLAELDALRAELDAARLNEWDTAPEGEHVMVTLRTVGWRVAGLWEWDDNGYWDVLGWQPLPDAPDDGGKGHNNTAAPDAGGEG